MLAAMLCAALLYFVRLGQPDQYIWDEVYHAYTAAELAEGNRDPYNPFANVPQADKDARGAVTYEWTHPAFAKLPMQAGILLFGDTPWGWRFSSAVTGVLGIGVFWGLGRTMFGRQTALLATALLLVDGLWFIESRLAMNDIFLVTFLLLAYLSFFLYLTRPLEQRWRYLWPTGAALGFAVASKWSALYSIGLLGLVAGLRELVFWVRAIRLSPPRGLAMALAGVLGLCAALLAIPAVLYFASYVQYFSMGYSLADWRELQRQMWWYHSNLQACHNYASPWWSWPLLLRPVWFYLYIMGNPLSWWLYLPAIVYVGVQWWRGRSVPGRLGGVARPSTALGLVLLGYLGQWLPWSLSPRVAYLYHMLPTVPFACLALGYVLNRLLEDYGRGGRRVVAVYLGLVVVCFGFFYSTYTLLEVPAWYANAHFWLPTWPAGSEWAFKCPTSSFTLLDLIPLLRTN